VIAGVVKERRLSDARLAAQDECRAALPTGAIQDRVELALLP
jgi:hypothetical protein